MKNSETSTIAIPRNKEIQANIHTAMIRLNEFNGWKVGLPLMVKYYNEDHKVDTIFAIGVKDSGASTSWIQLSDVPSQYVEVPILPQGGDPRLNYREKKYYTYDLSWDDGEAIALTYTWTKLAQDPGQGDYRVFYNSFPVSSSEATPENPATKGTEGEIIKVVLGVVEGEDYDLPYNLNFNLTETSYWICDVNEIEGVIVPPNNKLPDPAEPNKIYRITEYYIYSENSWRRIDESSVSGDPIEVSELPETGEEGVTYMMDRYYIYYGTWNRLDYIPQYYDEEVTELPTTGEENKIYYMIPDEYYSCSYNGASGRDFYSIISTSEEFVVDDILEVKPNITYVINGERYLYYYENETDKEKGMGQWRIAKRLGNTLGPGVPISENVHIIKNLSDKFRYFYKRWTTTEGGIEETLRREDDILTLEDLTIELGKITTNTITEFWIEGGDTYSNETPKTGILVHIKIDNDRGEEVTNEFNLEVLESENTERLDANTIKINDEISSTTTYTLRATKENSPNLEKTFTIYLVNNTYYGKMENFSALTITGLEHTLWNGQGEFEFVSNLVNEVTVFAVPVNLTTHPFSSIKDTHGLNYLEDYEIINYPILGVNYRVYHKIDQVTINNFKQIFGYE